MLLLFDGPKLLSLKLDTRPKQFEGSLPSDIAFPLRRYDTQHNGTQHNDIQRDNTQLNI